MRTALFCSLPRRDAEEYFFNLRIQEHKWCRKNTSAAKLCNSGSCHIKSCHVQSLCSRVPTYFRIPNHWPSKNIFYLNEKPRFKFSDEIYRPKILTLSVWETKSFSNPKCSQKLPLTNPETFMHLRQHARTQPTTDEDQICKVRVSCLFACLLDLSDLKYEKIWGNRKKTGK